MRYIYLLILFGFIYLLMGCDKRENMVAENDLSGSESIRGRLFAYDNEILQLENAPLANKKVFIQYNGQNGEIDNNALFSAITDNDGYFIFHNLKAETQYRIYFEDSINGVLFSEDSLMIPPRDSIALIARIPSKKQTGVVFTLRDPNGLGIVKGGVVCVYGSQAFINDSCKGSLFSLTSNEYGKAWQINLAPGTYYFNASITINGQIFSERESFNITDDIVRKDISLKPTPSLNGIRMLVIDSVGARIPNAELCFFTSNILFQKDTCSGSNFQLISDINGVAQKNSIPPTRYYVVGRKKISEEFTLIGRDTIDVGSLLEIGTIILK